MKKEKNPEKKKEKKQEKKKEKQLWKEQTITRKILIILQTIISISIIVLTILQITEIWEDAIKIFEPLLGILIILLALEQWKKNRKYACFLLLLAILIFLAMALVLYKQLL